jgi:hypothetical protein
VVVDLEATSIDADEYLAGIHGGPRGDGDKDLRAIDLFGARERDANDGDDGMVTPTPSSNASSMAARTLSSTQWGQRAVMTQKTCKTCVRTSDVWNDFEELFNIINGKKTRYDAKCHY